MHLTESWDIMNTMNRIALGTVALLAPLVVLAPADAAGPAPIGHAYGWHHHHQVPSYCLIGTVSMVPGKTC